MPAAMLRPPEPAHPHAFMDRIADDVSISGVKIICTKSANIFRRLIWALTLMGMATWFGLYALASTRKLISYPTSIRLQSKYQRPLKFPAITICNANTIRASMLYRFSLNESFPFGLMRPTTISLITQYVKLMWRHDISDNNHTQKWQDEYRQWNDTYSSILQMDSNMYLNQLAAHQLKDLIISCRWKRLSCGPENFTSVSTDVGQCYTFNGDRKNPMTVQSAGATSALQLSVNVELYEYMIGILHTAGLKILVHDQDENATQVKDYGLDIAPGMTTSISLAVKKVVLLPEPYGNCSKTSSLRSCLMNCTSHYIISQCGCRGLYMNGEAKYCTANQMLTCVIKQMEKFPSLRNYSDYCLCSPACNYDQYDTTITASPLSPIVLQQVALSPTSEKFKVHYKEAIFLQEWMLLLSVDKYYIDVMANISNGLNSVVMRLLQTKSILEDFHLSGSQVSNHTIAIKNAWRSMFDRLKDFIFSSYYYINAFSKYRRIDEVNIRMAHDLLAQSNKLPLLLSGIQKITTEWLANIKIVNLTNPSEKVVSTLKYNLAIRNEILQMNTSFMSLQSQVEKDEHVWIRHVPMSTKLNLEFYKSNYLQLQIYFKELTVTKVVQQRAYELLDFIGAIGGNLGIFLGGSILTLVELADILITYGWATSKEKRPVEPQKTTTTKKEIPEIKCPP